MIGSNDLYGYDKLPDFRISDQDELRKAPFGRF
jgi:hypothetical protein